MPLISVNNVDLDVETAGNGDHVVLLVHAYATTKDVWRLQIEDFQRSCTVVSYDMRGFGKSQAPTDPLAYSDASHVQDLVALLDRLGIRKASLCGLSMGGHIALMTALRHPERVETLLLASTGSGYDNSLLARDAQMWAITAREKGVEAFAESVLQHPLFKAYVARGAKQRQLLRDLVTASTSSGLANNAAYVLAKRPKLTTFLPQLQRLRTQTLIIVGKDDASCMAAAPTLAEALPCAELAVLSGAGHFCNLEDPLHFNGLVQRFFLRAFSGSVESGFPSENATT
jgi:pimeloyl-ACP methyl ester carboxylesterase